MRKTLILTCLGAMLALTASAQQNPVIELTLNRAIEIALDENPTIKVAELEIEKQTYVRRETIGNHLPQLSATGQYSRAIEKSEMGGGVSFEPDNTINISASLSVPLFAPAVYKTLKLNDEQMRAAVEDARGSKLTLVNEVKKSYYNILLAQQSLEVLRASEENVSATVKDAKNQFDAGLASEYDYITASVQLSNLQPTIIQTENSIEVAKKMLKMYLGLPLDVNVAVTGDLNDFAGSYNTRTALRDSDLAGNSDIRAMEAQIGILNRSLEVSRAQRLPTIAAFGSFALSGRDPLDLSSLMGSGPTAQSGTWQWWNQGLNPANDPYTGTWSGTSIYTPAPVAISSGSDSWLWQNPVSVGVQVSIPIFAGLTNHNRDKQTKYNITQLELQRDYLVESTNVQLQNARNAVVTADATIQANEITISQAQKGYDISRARYDGGMGTMLEVSSSELNLTQARLNYTQAIYDYLSAIADYEKLIGKEDQIIK